MKALLCKIFGHGKHYREFTTTTPDQLIKLSWCTRCLGAWQEVIKKEIKNEL